MLTLKTRPSRCSGVTSRMSASSPRIHALVRPEATSSGSATASPGWPAKSSSGTNDAAASTPIRRMRQAGGTNQIAISSPAIVPAGMAASHQPAAPAWSPRSATYGAASASGATAQVGTSQPSSSTRRTRGLASTADMPASESSSTFVRCAGSTSPPSGARERVPRRTTSAEPAKLAQSISSAPRGEESAISRPPAPLPTTCADWATMRKSERPAMNTFAGSTTTSSVLRMPAATGETRPRTKSSASRMGIGTAETAISATIAAESRSQAIIRRRGGTRSTRLESSAPPKR